MDRNLKSDDARLTPDVCAVISAEETFTLKNTLGLDLSHSSNMICAMASSIARDGDHASVGSGLRWGYGLDALKADEIAAECNKDALQKLEAERMKSGVYPVVIKNTAMADLLTTFCGIFSADNAQKGLSLLAGREGEAIASASVTLTDDPLMPWGMASCPFDREGAATYTKNIIDGRRAENAAAQPQDREKSGLQDDRKRRWCGQGCAEQPVHQAGRAYAGRAAQQSGRRSVSDRGFRSARGRESHQRRLLPALPRI